jgi:molybdopterin molybdotransferase
VITFEKALEIVLSIPVNRMSIQVSLPEAAGMVLAGDVFSDMDMPPFNKSAVDGYACRFDDLIRKDSASSGGGRVLLSVLETIAAGSVPSRQIQPGSCSRIMTGAMIPDGADCVVMVEDTTPAEDGMVEINPGPVSGNICFKGEDIRKGEKILDRGTLIRPAEVAILAGVGYANPKVYRRPSVAILSTGDELVEPDQVPGIGQIRNSNAWQLLAQASATGATVNYSGIAHDHPGLLLIALNNALENNDIVLLTGGVSMGDFDFVPEIMKKAGMEILFSKIAIQPGKPTVFGSNGNQVVFGLPGNPVSSFILFEMLVKPFLYHWMGHHHQPAELMLPMGVPFLRKKKERKSLIPARIRDGKVFPVAYHGSAHINAYASANAILVIGIGSEGYHTGDPAHVRLL